MAASFKPDVDEFHELVDGRLVAIHDMLNTIAMANSKPPLPPPAIAYLCDLTEEQGKGCGPEGPQVTKEQLLGAFAKIIPPGHPKEVFEERFIQHVRDASKRRRHANKVMPELEPLLLALHSKTGGAADKLYSWFLDLLPAQARETFPKEAFMGMIMRTPTVCMELSVCSWLCMRADDGMPCLTPRPNCRRGLSLALATSSTVCALTWMKTIPSTSSRRSLTSTWHCNPYITWHLKSNHTHRH